MCYEMATAPSLYGSWLETVVRLISTIGDMKYIARSITASRSLADLGHVSSHTLLRLYVNSFQYF